MIKDVVLMYLSLYHFKKIDNKIIRYFLIKKIHAKVSSSYHLCVKCFSQLSFDSEVYTKSAAVADFVHTSESNESCEKHLTQR